MPSAEPIDRPTARVLLLDRSGHILLQRFVGEYDGLPFWVPPGGGLHPGESSRAGAIREVFEETGLPDLVLGPHVWDRTHVWEWRGVTYRSIETWFLAEPVERFEPIADHQTAEETVDITGWRWFSIPELVSERPRTVPLDLAVRLRRLLLEGPPTEPESIGP